jgi:hypothetical protein
MRPISNGISPNQGLIRVRPKARSCPRLTGSLTQSRTQRISNMPVPWPGILEFAGKRFLILDSPNLVEPRKGAWPILGAFLLNLLEGDNSPSSTDG